MLPDICVYQHNLARRRAVSGGGATQGLRREVGHIPIDGAGYTVPREFWLSQFKNSVENLKEVQQRVAEG